MHVELRKRDDVEEKRNMLKKIALTATEMPAERSESDLEYLKLIETGGRREIYSERSPIRRYHNKRA